MSEHSLLPLYFPSSNLMFLIESATLFSRLAIQIQYYDTHNYTFFLDLLHMSDLLCFLALQIWESKQSPLPAMCHLCSYQANAKCKGDCGCCLYLYNSGGDYCVWDLRISGQL